MTSQTFTYTNRGGYLYAINGRRVERGKIIRLHATGQRVRFHAIRKWDRLYWTADGGRTFANTKVEAMEIGRDHLDVLEG